VSRAVVTDEIRSARLEAALDKAVESGSMTELFDQLDRGSNLPGTRPNLELARAVGVALAAKRARADAVIQALLDAKTEYPVIVASHALAQRVIAGVDARGSSTVLHDLAGDERHLVRLGVTSAVRVLVSARGEEGIRELAAWTDGYLHAHVVLEALADRELLAALPSGAEVLARLDEAFTLADASPRAAERSQGLRSLRGGFPRQIAVIAARFPEAIPWLAERATWKRPETRDVVAEAIVALRRSGLRNADADRLTQSLGASAPPPRDPSRIVQGTRKRSKGRK
jgi:hypothetical protein